MSRGTWDTHTAASDFEYKTFTLYGYLFQSIPLSSTDPMFESRNPRYRMVPGLGSSHFARRYSGNRFRFLFLALLRCFSSGGALSQAYVFASEYPAMRGGLLHSEITGS